MSHDRFSHYDAAYVLGALSPGERNEFVKHLQDCQKCRQAVSEVAGLPGLLARLDPAELEAVGSDPAEPTDSDAGPVPDTLLPRLLAEVSRSSRRRRTRVLAMSAAAAAVVAAVSAGATAGVTGLLSENTSGPVVAGAPVRAMRPVGHTSLTAQVAMEQVAWGTRLSITCRYDSDHYQNAAAPRYALVVRTRDGSEEQVATWRAVPDRPLTVTAATAARPAEIRSVEVRTPEGDPVLRLAG